MQPFRWWQLLSRSLFHLRLRDPQGAVERWAVDVHIWGNSNGDVVARLYREGLHHATSKMPAVLPVTGGAVEVATSTYGLKRCHYVPDVGEERQLLPDPVSAEGLRARLDRSHPALSRAIGITSFVVVLVALVLGLPQILEQVTSIPFIADSVGTFTSPIRLPGWLNVTLLVAGIVASTERALRLRNNWLLDGGFFEGDD